MVVLAVAVVAAHAGLAGAGQWQADEYFNFGMLRRLGGYFLRDRLLHWSPRPISEAVLYAYARAVDAARQPLIAPLLLGCWAGLAAALAAGCAGAWWLGLAPVLFALLLLGHPVDELFYWPMGAAPYLLCLAGVSLVSLRVAGGATGEAGRAACAAGLVLAAGSAELGVLFTLCLCPLLMLQEARAGTARWAGWSVPLLLALVPLALVLQGRVAQPDGAAAAHGRFYHHAGASLLAGATAFGRELAGGSWAGRLSGVLLVAGAALSLDGRAAVNRARAGAVMVALLATSFGSIAAAYYQFGRLCCERHASFRHGLMVLALVAAGALLAPRRRRAVAGWLGPALLAGAMLAPLPRRAADLWHDYRLRGAAVAARQASWRSGLGPGETMVFSLPPSGRVVTLGAWIAPGRYRAGGPWFATGLLQFFDKRAVEVGGSRGPVQR